MLSATRAQLPALLLLLLTAARASSESNALESATTTAASTTSGVREENRALRRELKTLLTSMLTRLESHESNIKLIGFDTTKYLGLRLESLLESNITKCLASRLEAKSDSSAAKKMSLISCTTPWVKFRSLCLLAVCEHKTWPEARQRCRSV